MTHRPFHATITKYTHYFKIEYPTQAMYPVIYGLAGVYTQFERVFDKATKRTNWVPSKTYSTYIDQGNEFRFNIGQFNDFIERLSAARIESSSYVIVTHDSTEASDIDISVREGYVLYPEQQEAHDFVVRKETGNVAMIAIPTGGGKTVTGLSAVATLGKRFAVIVLASYVDKWVGDICEILTIDKSEVGVIKGSDLLIRSTHYPGSNLPIPKAFVISISTLNNWYKIYEECRTAPQLEAYGCSVDDFYQHLGIGTVIFDEVHQHPHAVYRAHNYLNVSKSIALSATLIARDPILQRVQSMMFPKFIRFEKVKMKKYITGHACAYQIMDFIRSKIRTTEWGMNSYSHTAFEASILKQKNMQKQYFEMIGDLVERAYCHRYVDGDKLAIFVATKAMATQLTEYIKRRFPKYDTRTYLQENDYKDIIEPDIRVTTILSGGTAIDIPNLRVSIMTNSVDSPIQNIQTLGRLREMKHRTEHNDVHFYYLYCSTIPKHVEYHRNKIDLFSDRLLELKEEFLGTLYP